MVRPASAFRSLLVLVALALGVVGIAPGSAVADPVAGVIAGRITDDDGAGVAGNVVVYTLSGSGQILSDRTTPTAPDGAFSVGGLAAGDYLVRFTAARHRWAYYPGVDTRADAEPVHVEEGGTVTLAPVLDRLTSWVAGTVRGSAGQPIAGARVTAYDAAGLTTWGNASTDATGAYELYLPAGTFDIAVGADGYTPVYLRDVVVADGAHAMADTTLYRASSVSGTVRKPGGGALGGASVWLCGGPTGGCSIPVTDGQGQWSVGLLAPGDYTIRYTASGYQQQYHAGHLVPSSADDLAIAEGTDLTLDAVTLDLLPADAPTIDATTPPTVVGTPRVGQTLTAVAGECSSAADEVEYFWLVAGSFAGNGRTLALTQDHAGQSVGLSFRCYAKGRKVGVEQSSMVGPVGPADPRVLSFSVAPTIEGPARPRVGDTLTAKPGTWSPAPTDYTYRWLADGASVGVSASYTVRADDLGKRITAEVTPFLLDHTATATPTAPTARVAQGVITTPAGLTLSSRSPRAGEPVTVNGSFAPAAAEVHYQWWADGEVVGTDAPGYTPPTNLLGIPLTVVVTASVEGYAPFTRVLSTGAVSGGPIGSTAAPSLSGPAHPTVGDTLTLDPGTWAPTPTSYSIVWKADDQVIGAADDDTSHTLTVEEVGKRISATVTAKRTNYADTTVPTAATEPVAPGTLVEQTPASLSTDHPQVGGPVTVRPGGWLPAGASLTYAWTSDSVPVGTGTATYTPVAGDKGHTLAVTITAQKAGYHPAVRTLSTAPVAAMPQLIPSIIQAVTPPRGARIVKGRVIRVRVPLAAGATATYQWRLTPARRGKKEPRAKVVGHRDSIKPRKAWRGGRLSVVVIVTQPGHVATTFTLTVHGRLR